MSAIDNMMKTLEGFFAETDTKFVVGQVEWAVSRREALWAWMKTTEAKELIKKNYGDDYYFAAWAMCGGKTWYRMFKDYDVASLKVIVEKKCLQTISARNSNIVGKLEKSGVTEILSEEFSRTSDGFHGVFRVMTDKGSKSVKIDTILAGGYNIQCLHLRTLVKVR